MTTTHNDAELTMLRERVAKLEAAQATSSAEGARFEGVKQLSEAIENQRLGPFMFWHSYPRKWRRLIIWPQLAIWAGLAVWVIGSGITGLLPDPEEPERQAYYATMAEVDRDITALPGLTPMHEAEVIRKREMERRMAAQGFPDYRYGE